MFAAHGNFDLEVSGNVLIANIKGAWNRETAVEYDKQVKGIIRQFNHQAFGMVSLLDEWELFTPDCRPVISDLVIFALEKGMTKEALVNQVDSFKLDSFALKIPKYPNFERQIFRNKEDGLAWLATHGFKLVD